MDNILLYCRAGFESECSQEFSEASKRFGSGDVASAEVGSGHVVFRFSNASSASACIQSLPFSSLAFSRQMIAASGLVGPLSAGNRVAPVMDVITKTGLRYSEIFIETADTNDAKQLSPLCKKLFIPFSAALKKENLLVDSGEIAADSKRLHVFFTATDQAFFGYSFITNSSSWPMGIPRLKFPSGAPSRSTLKLEEAFLVFLTEEQRKKSLRPGLSAVDLGASPGGWTWQFVSRGIRVSAVDNGNMDQRLLDSGLVHHVRGDGFTFTPKKPVDWMVCDIVEQPSRIARLCAQWIGRKWCRFSVFNLKLPMKKRYDEVKRCRDIIASELEKHGMRYELSIKQLYHDREEVTAYLRGI
jgi:23S rRNA (cytidine2498-2'-O)-methyltransferase